jgi:hypothetical protein
VKTEAVHENPNNTFKTERIKGIFNDFPVHRPCLISYYVYCATTFAQQRLSLLLKSIKFCITLDRNVFTCSEVIDTFSGQSVRVAILLVLRCSTKPFFINN